MSDDPSETRFSGLGLRLVSGLILAGVVLAVVHVGGPWLTGLVCGIGLLMAREWPELCLAGAGARPLWRAGPPFAALLFVAVAVAALAFLVLGRLYVGAIASVFGAVLVALVARGPAPSRLLLALGLPYIIVPSAALLWLALGPTGRSSLYWLLAVVWATDIGGYGVGKLVGGPRLAPVLSPGKTWSGFFGGTVLAVLVAVAVGVALSPALLGEAGPTMPRLALVGFAASLAAQAGDLAESAVKRHFAVKDSGSIIPGHGGLFDRLDGLFAAAVLMAGLATVQNMGLTWN